MGQGEGWWGGVRLKFDVSPSSYLFPLFKYILSFIYSVASSHLWICYEVTTRPAHKVHLFYPPKICIGIVLDFGQVLENFQKSTESDHKIFGKLSKTPSSVCLYNKKTLHNNTKIGILCSCGKNNLTSEMMLLPLKHKIHIFSPLCNILYFFRDTL